MWLLYHEPSGDHSATPTKRGVVDVVAEQQSILVVP